MEIYFLEGKYLKLPKMTAVRMKLQPSDIRKMETEICDSQQGAIRKIFCQSFILL